MPQRCLLVAVAALAPVLSSCGLLGPRPEHGSVTLSAEPTEVAVAAGASAVVRVTVRFVAPQNGGRNLGWVDLSLTGAPQGVGVIFVPRTVANGGVPDVYTSQLTLAVAASVPPGPYNLKVRATSTSERWESGLRLTVTPSQ